MRRPRIYFGHPVNTYNTELEKQWLARINIIFPGCDIENPNSPEHEKNYQERKKITGNGMDYFFQEVLPLCQTGIFLPFRDGKWGIGVYKEAKRLSEEHGRSIYEINFNGDFLVMNLNEIDRVLTIEETRARIRDREGNPLSY